MMHSAFLSLWTWRHLQSCSPRWRRFLSPRLSRHNPWPGTRSGAAGRSRVPRSDARSYVRSVRTLLVLYDIRPMRRRRSIIRFVPDKTQPDRLGVGVTGVAYMVMIAAHVPVTTANSEARCDRQRTEVRPRWWRPRCRGAQGCNGKRQTDWE